MSKYKLLPLLLVFIIIASCKDRVETEVFRKEIKATFSAEDSNGTGKGKAATMAANRYTVYRLNNFQPLWLNERAELDKPKAFLKELKSLSEEGLPADKYNVVALEDKINIIDNSKGQIDIEQVLDFEHLFTETYLTAANDLMFGVMNPREVTDMWYHDNDTSLNIAESFDKDFPSLKPYRSKHATYAALVQYRKEHANSDSLRNVIDANLERLRWLPQDFEEEYVLVVIPKLEVDLIERGNRTMNIKAIVGKTSRETPSLNADMKNIVFNPSWGVPPGILKKDVIPGLVSKGEAYINKKGLKVYDRQGNEVDVHTITTENYDNYIFRQPPSERNALGQVKFDLPNPYAIYLHDTPNKELFKKEERAFSSGCIRVEEPRKLANYILSEMGDKQYTMSEIDEIVSHNETEYVKLKKHVPVHIVYLTAHQPVGGKLEFYKDIYNRDMDIIKQL